MHSRPRGEGGESCVRFGLGAVKNVGHGPVDMILEGREDGPFEDLTDFANRVDLRKVGKRALESLIKVGALDSFGPRMALLLNGNHCWFTSDRKCPDQIAYLIWRREWRTW